jgi:hypothetical protein
VDTTLSVYTQVLDGSVREAVQKVGGALFTNERLRKGQGSNVKGEVITASH